MTTQTTGIVIDGALQLDHPLTLPDRSRVEVTVRPLTEAPQGSIEPFLKFAAAHPVDSGGLRYTRDE